MTATNADYFEGVARFAEQANSSGVPCVVASVPSSLMESHPLVHALKLPLAADWSPEPEFCAANKSGWRHVSVLKTQLLVLVLSAGYDCFVADADWQLSNVTLDVLMQLRASSWDIVGTNDYDGMNNGAGMLNVGMMWVRHTPDTELLAQAVANRSYAAWDQAVFNEEIDAASSVRCCCSAGLLHTAFEHVAANGKTTNEGKYAPSAQESCQATRPPLDASPPPNSTSLMFPNTWQPRGFNPVSTPRPESGCARTACEAPPFAPGPSMPPPAPVAARASRALLATDRQPSSKV